MKQKTSLTKLSMVLLIGVFAVAAALCLRGFVWADRTSRRDVQQDRAMLMAQTAVETLKHYGGSYDACAKELGGTWDGTAISVQDGKYRLTVLPREGTALLGRAVVQVCTAEGTLLAELTAAWQEG